MTETNDADTSNQRACPRLIASGTVRVAPPAPAQPPHVVALTFPLLRDIVVSHTFLDAMASSARSSLLLAGTVAVALLPYLTMAYSNSSLSTADMLRAQLALMNDRPDGCPPW